MKNTFRLAAVLVLGASLVTPLLAAAQSGINLGAITPYSDNLINAINGILVPVLIAIAFIVFLWGVYKYFILGAANESEKAEGRKFAMWGIIGFVIILSLWGIVNLVMGTLGLSVGKAPPFPTIGNYSGTAGNTGSNSFPGATTVGNGTGGITAAQSAALNQYYQQQTTACQQGNTVTCQQATAAYAQQFDSVYGGASSVNSGLGAGGTSGVVSPQLQTAATNAYESCQGSSSDNTGAQCQSVYSCVINGGSAAQCQTTSGAGTATGCTDPYADNPGSSSPCTYATAMTNCSNSSWIWDTSTHTCNEPTNTATSCTDPYADNQGASGPCTYGTAQTNCANSGWIWDSGTNTCNPSAIDQSI